MGGCIASQNTRSSDMIAPEVMFCKPAATSPPSPLALDPSAPTTPPKPSSPWRSSRVCPAVVDMGSEFPLAANPLLVLQVLSECCLSPEDLARLECSCALFRKASGVPPDGSISLAEVAALDMCKKRLSFADMTADQQMSLQFRCGGSWKLLLRFLRASEQATRRGERQVAAGCAHSLAVTGEGSVFTFGNGCAGQLGHGGTNCESRPKVIGGLGGARVVHAAAGRARTMMVTEGGGLFQVGRDGFGDADYSTQTPQPILAPTRVEQASHIWVVQVTLGSFFTAVLSRVGHVYTFSWGGVEGVRERLGHNTDSSDTEPRPLCFGPGELGTRGDLPVAQIAGGHCYLLALTFGGDGTPEGGGDRSVWSVGCGLGGKLGNGSRSDERVPVEVSHLKQIRGFRPIAIAAGAWHSAALSLDGRVATWGWGRHGCLGHGGDSCETLPRLIEGLGGGGPAVSVSAGDYTTFVIGRGGEVWSFGSVDSLCLGHEMEDLGEERPVEGGLEEPLMRRRKDVSSPRLLKAFSDRPEGDRIVQISASSAGQWDSHMLALTQHGTVLACGAGGKGQLGVELVGGGVERVVPEAIESLKL